MNARQEARLDAQARQMAFELGYGTDPRAERLAEKADYARREQEQERAAYAAKSRRDEVLASIRPVTEKQVAFIKRLVDERELDSVLLRDVAIARDLVMHGTLSTQGASTLIDSLLAAPKKSEAPAQRETAEEPEDGIYVVEAKGLTDDIYKVYTMVHGSGRQGVKKLHVEPGANTGSFEYLGLALYKLPREARRMTLEEAKKFGSIYGFCVRCGRTLTDEESIAAGIGPICADKM